MKCISTVLLIALLGLALGACSNDNARSSASNLSQNLSMGESPPTVPVTTAGGGAIAHQVLESRVDGADISFQVFEPKTLAVGQSYPLVLQGHGYGGSRQVAAGGFITRLTDAGYYVISIDQRGFGASGGTVRTMGPEHEGQDLVQILDWAEDLPGLRRRSNNEMYVGSFGGSYGGMYQMLLAAVDAKHRLRVLAPDITPHDLVYALNPNNVVKSGWGLALAGAGEAGAQNNGSVPNPENGQDPFIFETLTQAILTNSFSEASSNLFRYHSVKYFCDGLPAGSQEFTTPLVTPDALSVLPTPYAALDVLFTQGFRDTLFNFNDSFNNYNCLKASGGDVRLLTHQSGHILPVGVPAAIEEGFDPLYQAIALQAFQDAGGSRSCGTINLDDAQFAWFEEKLQGKAGAVDAVITTGSNVCLSLAADDHVAVANAIVGGTPYALDISMPQFSSALGIGGAVLGNGAREALLSTIPLYTAPAGGAILAGIPTMNLEFAGLSGEESEECPVPVNLAGCDPIVFLAVGHRKADSERWDLVDDQLTALRGFGAHSGQMTGIAERLAEGDQLALLIYGFHAQFPVTWSRDVFVPALDITGSVNLPLQ